MFCQAYKRGVRDSLRCLNQHKTKEINSSPRQAADKEQRFLFTIKHPWVFSADNRFELNYNSTSYSCIHLNIHYT